MSKRTVAVLTLAVAAVFLLSSVGCVSKKRYKMLEDQSAEQLSQANARIDDLTLATSGGFWHANGERLPW